MLRTATITGLAVALVGTGCDLNKLAADTTAKVADAGAPALAALWDYELVGEGIPASIMQAEAMRAVSPNNESILVGLAKAYVTYAYGWLEYEWELADAEADFEKSDAIERRVMYLYRRAKNVAMVALVNRDKKGLLKEKFKTGNPEVVMAYLREEFTSKDDVPSLYHTGLAWGASIANSGGDVKEFAMAEVARAVLARACEIDPAYNNAGGLGVLGSVEAMFPAVFGGSLEKAKELFERAIKLSKRRNHLILVGYARNYAVAAQNRELYLSLLREVLEAGDLGPDIRLSNKVARKRAELYIRQVDDLF